MGYSIEAAIGFFKLLSFSLPSSLVDVLVNFQRHTSFSLKSNEKCFVCAFIWSCPGNEADTKIQHIHNEDVGKQTLHTKGKGTHSHIHTNSRVPSYKMRIAKFLFLYFCERFAIVGFLCVVFVAKSMMDIHVVCVCNRHNVYHVYSLYGGVLCALFIANRQLQLKFCRFFYYKIDDPLGDNVIDRAHLHFI